jgi:hypothetical protein
MARFMTLTLAIPAGMALSPIVPLALCALWLLPDWIGKWLDIREKWARVR